MKRTKLRPRRKVRKGRVSDYTLDDLHRRFVRLRDKGCQAGLPDCWGDLDCAHFISRDYKKVRWLPENAALICKRHHAYHHDNSYLAGRFWTERLGSETCQALWERARGLGKVDRLAMKESLREKLREYEGE